MAATLSASAMLHAQTAAWKPPVPLQPFAEEVRQIEAVMSSFGEPLAPGDQAAINRALAGSNDEQAIASTAAILDKYTLAVLTINPESRVAARRGAASPDLVQNGNRLFLVKIENQAGTTASIAVESPNSGDVFVPSSGSPEPTQKLTPAEAQQRWAQIEFAPISFFAQEEKGTKLSGFGLEYRILEIYSRDAGERSALMNFNVGQGTREAGGNNEITVLFHIQPAHSILLHVRDENGRRTMASFIFRDQQDRVYPNPAKRLAPDFYFQPQIYRADSERVDLPDGTYSVEISGGPEYITEKRQITVSGDQPAELSFQLKRWIDPARFGWFSGDHHIHAAGCSHYENPTQGVLPKDMMRQVEGEHLNVGCVLTWGPCYYYQKQFFSGTDNPLSTRSELLHYDLEVSGFPSSHAGHLVLLGLRQQDYPGTKRIDDWPTWDLPILRWGKSQGATVGFAHSGLGLELKSDAIPNYEVPPYDGIGANEYIVDVTYPDTVDFISAGDTAYPWELNTWYHTLNVGFRTRISGETDFPCLYDSRVGEGRSYAAVHGPLTYANFLSAVRAGRNYVSDGRSHLMDFRANGQRLGENGSELRLNNGGTVTIDVKAAAYLDPKPDDSIRKLPFDQKPFWHLERARIGDSRRVPVELVVNGAAVARREIEADGRINNLQFQVPIRRSSWMALRILPSSHTNPIFVVVGGKPICASQRSTQWCLDGVNQCWTQKAASTSATDLAAMKQAYDHARTVYTDLLQRCDQQ